MVELLLDVLLALAGVDDDGDGDDDGTVADVVVGSGGGRARRSECIAPTVGNSAPIACTV